ncbi:MAG: hypothetical protein A3F46_03535 [Legionellales bacterium RIFCSPHIGHO2_12_FULL_42_9]|nr:MAG: hypothetical protein A3F46_03535 [Legionellales bacterium RIFCSPHIGHO2_12_FULL_42_9]
MPHKIKEIQTIHEALKGISYDTWFILDLDNTVMWSRLELGGDAWFGSLLKHACEHIHDEQTANALVIAIYRTVQFHMRTQAVEPGIVTIIKALQAIGIPVIGLTARDEYLEKPTVRQLKDIGIKLFKIIYCDGQHKGDKLINFLSQCEELPAHIAMVDDKGKYLKQVADMIEPLGINFTGFRYGFLDEKVKQFDMQTANIQLAYIKERFPKSVQDAIEQLHLVPEEQADRYSPSLFAHGFFQPGSRSESTSSEPELSEFDRAQELKLT